MSDKHMKSANSAEELINSQIESTSEKTKRNNGKS